MADSKRESREVGFKITDGCGNEACYCDGSCREDKARDLPIKVTADVNDAVTGFKSLSRELREATKAARELEQAYYSAAEAYEDVEKEIEECSGFETCKSSDALSQYCSCVDVEIDGKKVAKAVYATDFNLSTHRNLSEVPTELLREELSKRKRERLK